MNLSRYPVGAGVAVSHMDRASEFYEGKLGLSGGQTSSDGGRTYPCVKRDRHSPVSLARQRGESAATLAGWEVDDLDAVVDKLTSKGVAFEHDDQPPVVTDERGIARFPDGKVADFKDPDGNVLSIGSQTQGWKL